MRKRWYKMGGCGSKVGIFYTESDRPILLTTFFTRMKAFFVWCLTARARARGRSFWKASGRRREMGGIKETVKSRRRNWNCYVLNAWAGTYMEVSLAWPTMLLIESKLWRGNQVDRRRRSRGRKWEKKKKKRKKKKEKRNLKRKEKKGDKMRKWYVCFQGKKESGRYLRFQLDNSGM